MGLFAKRTNNSSHRTSRIRAGKSFAASTGAILDQMTITCDKVKSIHALRLAEAMFLNNVKLIRTNNGPEELALGWINEAGTIAYLISQIANNGGQVAQRRGPRAV